jgi:hypothetical protein
VTPVTVPEMVCGSGGGEFTPPAMKVNVVLLTVSVPPPPPPLLLPPPPLPPPPHDARTAHATAIRAQPKIRIHSLLFDCQVNR